MKEERRDTSVRLNEARRNKVEKIAIELSYETGRIIKMSNIINHLIDNYIKDAKRDIKEKRVLK